MPAEAALLSQTTGEKAVNTTSQLPSPSCCLSVHSVQRGEENRRRGNDRQAIGIGQNERSSSSSGGSPMRPRCHVIQRARGDGNSVLPRGKQSPSLSPSPRVQS
eukprot:scpid78663/ scgid12103/ 